MSSKTTHCPKCNELIDVKIPIEECIEEHACFDDDPCPLQGEFLKSIGEACSDKITCPKKIS
jgi:L-lactate utilization protein LutB